MLSPRQFVQDIFRFKKSMLFALALFVIGLVLGTVNADAIATFASSQLEGLGEVRDMIEATKSPQLNLFLFIFFNNAIKGVVIIYAGILFGILPIIFLVVNGVVIGFVLQLASNNGADVTDLIIRGLLPHGILEIPAIIIACGYGLHFGYIVLKSMKRSDSAKRAGEWKEFMKSTLTASFWVVLLLFVAAIIESTLTLYLVG